MKRYFQNNRDVAQYVDNILMNSESVLPLTMIITREKFVGFCVRTATTELSVDIAKSITVF